MRYLKPHFYDQFVCTAGDCPDTCCAGWQIVIDEDSLERYGNEKSEFGKRLRNSIDWEEECFYQNNRRCAFLNDENLCDLYKELGPDSLCDTCRLYPRHTEEYEGLRELSLSLSCPEAARIILSCKEPVRFLEEETDEEDDFEEFDFMMFSQLEDTRDVLFRILQNRELPLQERMTAAEQLAEQYQICMEEQREYDIDDLLRKYEKHLEEGTLSECVAESLAEKGVDAASFHAYDRQVKELAVLRGLERLRPEWDTVLDGTEKALYQNGETAYQAICEEFHRTWGAAGERRAEWENIGEQLLMFFVYTYFCGAVYDDMVCSKMELALFSVRWIQEILVARWLENGKTLSMHDIEELSWRYAREDVRSGDNQNAREGWLFETYAPEGVISSGGNINKVSKLLEKREGKPVGAPELRALYKDLLALPLEGRMEKYSLNAYRADVIVPALDIFLGVVDMSGAKQLVIPKIGLVDGTIRLMWLNADSLEDGVCPGLAH